MRVSEITREVVLDHLHENADILSETELSYIDSCKAAAVSYVKGWTGISGVDEPDEEGRKLDDYEDITFAVLAIISSMYDTRSMIVDKDKLNPMVTSVLNMHSFNLLPGADT